MTTTKKPNHSLLSSAQSLNDLSHDSGWDGSGVAVSKLHSIQSALSTPAIQNLGIEYRLFIHLLIISHGEIIGSTTEIGRQIGTNGRNINNWANKLNTAALITVTDLSNKQIHIKLNDALYEIANMSDMPDTSIVPDMPDESTQSLESPAHSMDEDLEELIAIYEMAKNTGQEISITTTKIINGNAA